MKLRTIVCGTLLLVGCGNNAPVNNVDQQATLKTQGDSLFEQVLAAHDVAMPKMAKLERLQKETKAALDSLNKAGKKADETLKAALEANLKQLDSANDSMNKWMEAFKYDSFKNNDAERAKYLAGEKVKAEAMRDAVLGSIKKAEEGLKR